MGSEIFVVWYHEGEQVRVPLAGVRAAFGAAASAPEARGFRVAYGDQGEAYVYATPGPDGTVDSVMVEKPCGAPALWDAIVAVMRLGHGLCAWPGDAQAVADPGVVAHLPDDVTEAMEPQVVEDGAALVRLVESSTACT